MNCSANFCLKPVKVTIHVGLAAKRLRATVNLGSSKKKPWLAHGLDVDYGQGLKQGQKVEQDFNGCEDEAVVTNTEESGGKDFFC